MHCLIWLWQQFSDVSTLPIEKWENRHRVGTLGSEPLEGVGRIKSYTKAGWRLKLRSRSLSQTAYIPALPRGSWVWRLFFQKYNWIKSGLDVEIHVHIWLPSPVSCWAPASAWIPKERLGSQAGRPAAAVSTWTCFVWPECLSMGHLDFWSPWSSCLLDHDFVLSLTNVCCHHLPGLLGTLDSVPPHARSLFIKWKCATSCQYFNTRSCNLTALFWGVPAD